MSKPSQRLALTIAAASGAVLAIILGLIFYFNHDYIADLISSLSFSAPAEIVELENHLELTDRAKMMFSATHPSLADRQSFSDRCNPDQEEISVLGCYTGGKIYLFDIDEPELSGIVESTAAHELLHAAWERLDSATKNNVSTKLLDIYNNEKYHDLLAEDLSIYEDSERIDELHSRIGTEIADLPTELEDYYSRYFNDQNQIVDYYDNYIAPFKELSEEINNLTSKLETLEKEIDSGTKSYYEAAEKLSKEIDDFNSCADTLGCFASETAFYNKRSELVSKQSSLDDMYDALDKKIKDYNSLVEDYNANIIRGKDLENAINSNSKVEQFN